MVVKFFYYRFDIVIFIINVLNEYIYKGINIIITSMG